MLCSLNYLIIYTASPPKENRPSFRSKMLILYPNSPHLSPGRVCAHTNFSHIHPNFPPGFDVTNLPLLARRCHFSYAFGFSRIPFPTSFLPSLLFLFCWNKPTTKPKQIKHHIIPFAPLPRPELLEVREVWVEVHWGIIVLGLSCWLRRAGGLYVHICIPTYTYPPTQKDQESLPSLPFPSFFCSSFFLFL